MPLALRLHEVRDLRFRDTWNSVRVTRLEEEQTGGGQGHAAEATSWRVSLGPFYLKPHLLPAHPTLSNSVCSLVAFGGCD